MKPGRPGLSWTVLTCLLAWGAWLGLACDDGERTARREVVVYCSADQEFAEPILAEFEKATGIKVRARYDAEADKTVGLVNRIREELKAGKPSADVFWSSEVFYTIQLARDGLLAPHESERTKDWPAPFFDAQRRWHGFGVRARVICYHTGRVKAQEAPRTLEDLLEPKWKDRLAMASPTFGTTGGDVASWFVCYGEAGAREILRGLKANQVRIAPANSDAVRRVGEGQVDLCLTDTDDVYARQRDGWPVAFHYLDQGGRGVLTIPNTVMRIHGAAHPKEAAALIDFILGGRVETLLAESDSHNTPVLPAVAEKFPQYRIPRPLNVDYGKVADALKPAIRTAREILR